jgi:hypothetical protein
MDYFDRLLEQFRGAKIVKPFHHEEGNETWYGLVVELTNGEIKTIWFLRDEEGNGPGSFEIGDWKPELDIFTIV